MKIAYIGDFINHGTSLQTIGTSLVILLSEVDNVTSIDVYCPKMNKVTEEFQIPRKVNIINFYMYDHTLSIMKLLHVQWSKYDVIIFNMLPTGFGKTSLSNVTALMVPLILTKLFRMHNIKIIYHNSVFTNDFKTLGYNSFYNRIRSYFLGRVEKSIFKNIPTFVFLNLYKERIDKAIGKNKVDVLDAHYLEAITTIYMNNLIEKKFLEIKKNKIPIILLHGYWGPQKNIEFALSILSKLNDEGVKFKLVISGGVNTHFANYESKFKKLLETYSNIIYEYLGYIKEKDILNMFIKADILLLPYNVPGGHSGVLEQGMFFEVPIIAFDFPEYREQAAGNPIVKLIKPEELGEALDAMLNSTRKTEIINIENKIISVNNNVKLILSK